LIGTIIKKLLYGLTVLWGVVTVVFIIFNIKSGDPAQMLLGQRATEEAKLAIEKELGLDLSFGKQYLLYINDLSPLSYHNTLSEDSYVYYDESKYGGVKLLSVSDKAMVLKYPYLRRSYQTKQNVSTIIGESLPGTVVLAGSAILFALILGGIIGVLSALWKDSFFDKSTLVLAVLGMSMPSFYTAIIVSWIFGFLWYETTALPMLPIVVGLIFMLVSLLSKKGARNLWGYVSQFCKGALWGLILWGIVVVIEPFVGSKLFAWINPYINLPGTYLNQSGSLYEIDVFEGPYLSMRNLILPMLTLGIRPLAVIVQLLRNSLLEVMGMDYIRTAKANPCLPVRCLLSLYLVGKA